MKIIYKLFIMALILRMTPAIIIATGVFPNTTLESLGYDYTATSDPWQLLMLIVSPNPISTGITIPVINYTVSVQLTLTAIIGMLGIVAIARDRALPTVIASLTAMMIIPFIVDVGYTIIREQQTSYPSASLTLMLIAIVVGFIAVGILHLLDSAKQEEGVKDQ